LLLMRHKEKKVTGDDKTMPGSVEQPPPANATTEQP
jgi:hypothetical protein